MAELLTLCFAVGRVLSCAFSEFQKGFTAPRVEGDFEKGQRSSTA